MKFNFKIQQYKTDAVDAVCNVFTRQAYHEMSIYRRDISKVNKAENKQISFDMADEYDERLDLENKTDFKNELVTLSYEQLLRNIHQLQIENNIKLSPALVKNFGRCGLDIETETGTGKTYVYIKTMFNLKLLIHSDQ